MSTFTSDPSTTPVDHQQHPLANTWALYYHLPEDKNWTLSSYIRIMDRIHTMEEIMALTQTLSDNVIKYCMLFLMKQGITPMWEDTRNRNGGAFSYKVLNKHVPEIWRQLSYLLTGNRLTHDPAHMSKVNGITISPKKNFCIIKIWMCDCSLQDPAIITPIEHLMKNGSLFKSHKPEF
jgi:Eukaryotic initiation factor 4E